MYFVLQIIVFLSVFQTILTQYHLQYGFSLSLEATIPVSSNFLCVATTEYAVFVHEDGCYWCKCYFGSNNPICEKNKQCNPAQKAMSGNGGSCFGYARWRRSCEWCECIKNQARCISAQCKTTKRRTIGFSNTFEQSIPTDENIACQATGQILGRFINEDGCNWCTCRGKSAGCYRRNCHEDERLYGNAGQCEGQVRWRRECQWCECVNGTPNCTPAFCSGKPTNKPHSSRVVLKQQGGLEICRDLQGNARFLDNKKCNWCSCSDGYAKCTKLACIPGERLLTTSNKECSGHVEWTRGCEKCTCYQERENCITIPNCQMN